MIAIGASAPGTQYWFGTIQPRRLKAMWTRRSWSAVPLVARLDPAPFAHPFAEIEDAAPLQDGVDQLAAQFGIVHRVVDHIETRHLPARHPADPSSSGVSSFASSRSISHASTPPPEMASKPMASQ